MSKNNLLWIKAYFIVFSIMILFGCGGSTAGTGAGTPEPNDSEYTGYLVEVTDDSQLQSFVANSIQQNTINTFVDDAVTVTDIATDELAATNEQSPDANSDFSQTTLIEQGVDEMDLVKYDGNTIFQRYVDSVTGMHSVRLLSTNDNATTTVINSIDVNTSASETISGLYLFQNESALNLVVMSVNYGYTYYDCPPDMLCASVYGPSQRSSYKISRYDVSDTSNPILLGEQTFSGNLNQSRRIDNKLYTVSGLNFITTYNSDNSKAPEDITISDIIPEVVNEQNQEQTWFSSSACYIPQNVTTSNFQLYMTVITTTDLNTGSYSANCFVGYSNDFYASTQAMYFTESVWQGNITRIHQFDFTDTGVEYSGSGSVIGYLSGRSASSFKMNEYNGYLRVLSSKRNNFGLIDPVFVDSIESELSLTSEDQILEVEGADHYLTVLQKVEGQKELQVVSRIPNATEPTAIGKPGEDVFAVRFMQNTAYVVTFFQIDPFYTIDLSNPESPRVRGELEIPGFSSLLFPINEQFVMGVGQEDGLKIDVYDVSDLDNPTRSDQYLFGQYFYSPALYDHKTISFLYSQTEQMMRVSLPAQSYAYNTNQATTGLHLFEINGTTGDIETTGSLITESNPNLSVEWRSIYDTRSIIDGDHIHYVTPRPIYSSFWDDLSIISITE